MKRRVTRVSFAWACNASAFPSYSHTCQTMAQTMSLVDTKDGLPESSLAFSSSITWPQTISNHPLIMNMSIAPGNNRNNYRKWASHTT